MNIGMVTDIAVEGRISGETHFIEQNAGYNVRILKLNPKLRPFISSSFLFRWIWRLRVRRFVRKNNIDVLHAHNLYTVPSCLGHNVPVLVDMHEDYAEAVYNYPQHMGWKARLTNPSFWKERQRRLLSKVGAILVLDDNLGLHLKRSIDDEQRVFQIPNSVAVTRHCFDGLSKPMYWEDMVKFKNRKPGLNLLYWGKIARRRGSFEILAWTLGLNVNLTFIGPVDKADKKHFFKACELHGRVIYVPWVSPEDIKPYFKEHDLGLCTTPASVANRYGAPKKFWYYMAGELPVLCMDRPTIYNIMRSNRVGEIYSNKFALRSHINMSKHSYAVRSYMEKVWDDQEKIYPGLFATIYEQIYNDFLEQRILNK